MPPGKAVRVLFVNEYFPPYAPGGAEWSTLRWARVLIELGHDVHVATIKRGGPEYRNENGVKVHSIPLPLKCPRDQRTLPSWLTESPIYWLYFALWIWRIARRERAQIIHAQSKGSLISAWIAARLLRLPIFLTVRDTGLLCPLSTCLVQFRRIPDDCSYWRLITKDSAFYQSNYLRHQNILARALLICRLTPKWFVTKVRQAAMKRLSVLIFVSHGLSDVYAQTLLRGQSSLSVIYNPIDEESGINEPDSLVSALNTAKLDGRRIVLTPGKLSPGKGTPVLLEAATRLATDFPNVLFVLAGKGRLRWPRPENVLLAGSLPHDELLRFYRLAELVVVPSVWPEPLSRVILEGMLNARPIVATRTGGIPEQIENGRTGLLVPPGDTQALAEGIAKLLNDPSLAASLGCEAKKTVIKKFSARVLAPQLVGLYRKAVAINAKPQD